jgi:pSer/pThr/pTyr-binding forkhead associated (FHA) protein
VEAMSAEIIAVEHLDGHGRVLARERFALSGGRRTLTIGRSIDADVTLDDPHVAAMHASLEITPDGRILASDLGSVNGLIVSGRRLCNVSGLELADNVLQIGRTRLRVRTARERLEPERPYPLPASSLLRDPAWIAGIGALAVGLQLVYGSWLGAPRDLAVSIVTSLATAVLVVAVWVAFWGLLSRVMQGEWRWLRHAAIFLGVSATFVAVMGLVDVSGFLFGLPAWDNRQIWVGAVALGCALYLHLMHASHLAASRAALVAGIIPVLLAAGSQWLQDRYLVRDVNHIGARMRIYPAALRLRPSDTLESYFARTTTLRELANKRLSEALATERKKDED